jgi:hypothetical protein
MRVGLITANAPRPPRRGCGVLSVLALVLISAGCSSSDPSGETPVPSDGLMTNEQCTDAVNGTVNAELAAACMYRAWANQDITLVAAYGVPGVLDDLPTAGDDPMMTFEGCVEAEAANETVCSWFGDVEPAPVTFRMHATGDDTGRFRVVAVDLET